MTTAGSDLADELRSVEQARGGDHDAFVRLYRQDAPPAWRLALALTADPGRAADAVARAFARVLAPARPGAPRSPEPFRLRLLTATRHVVLDQGLHAPRLEADLDQLRSGRTAEVMQAFHQLPERWRTVLWLAAVEGTDLAAAARVLGVEPDGAADLAERAEAGLRTQWQRDRIAAGGEASVAPEQLPRALQSVLPLPKDLFAEVEARWRAQRERKVGPVGLVLPGGRAVPRWAERGLLAGTAAVIAAGITGALVVDRDPDVRRARSGQLAAPAPSTTLGPTPTPPEPRAYLDGEPDAPGGTGAETETVLVASRASAGAGAPAGLDTPERVTAVAAAGATPVAPATRPRASTEPPPPASPSTTVEPRLEVTAGVGPPLALSLGDQCTGLSLGGQPVGCRPDPDTGVSVEGSLLP